MYIVLIKYFHNQADSVSAACRPDTLFLSLLIINIILISYTAVQLGILSLLLPVIKKSSTF